MVLKVRHKIRWYRGSPTDSIGDFVSGDMVEGASTSLSIVMWLRKSFKGRAPRTFTPYKKLLCICFSYFEVESIRNVRARRFELLLVVPANANWAYSERKMTVIWPLMTHDYY